MRYEFKIPLPEDDYHTVIRKLFSSNYLIREIYQERQINNIYFDTLGYTDYLSNTHGDSERKKYRIRWYGKLNDKITSPTLEQKYKKGMLGGKKSISLPEFIFDSSFSFQNYSSYLKERLLSSSDEYDWMVGELLQRNPVLVNQYRRRYYLTANGKYRITLDHDIMYYHYQSALYNKNNTFGTRDPRMIIEIKFDAKDLRGAEQLINDLGYRVYKNSKYVNGINAILYHSTFQVE